MQWIDVGEKFWWCQYWLFTSGHLFQIIQDILKWTLPKEKSIQNIFSEKFLQRKRTNWTWEYGNQNPFNKFLNRPEFSLFCFAQPLYRGLPQCDSGLLWCFKQASRWNLVLIFPSIIEIPRGGVDCRDCQETWYSWTAWEFQDHWDYLNILIMINGIRVKNVISSQAIQKSKWTQRSKVYCECCNYQCNPMQLIKWHLEK